MDRRAPGAGVPQSLVVAIPGPDDATPGAPTGIVYNGSAAFVVSAGGLSGPSRFIFAGEDGVVSAWAPNVDLTHAKRAVVAADSIYKGLALAANGSANRLYATDFHNNRIDVYDAKFQKVDTAGGFADPNLPPRFAPFGIQNLNGDLYVTYALQDANAEDDQKGPGRGFVNVFDAEGHLLRRVASRIGLNAPWGIALAPADFGAASNRLRIGNFGDGTISTYDAATGLFMGALMMSEGKTVQIPGLWGLQFGNGLSGQPTGTPYFAAGPNDENDGIYGSIKAKGGGY
jgi:uncharacterized protein (TIGR03118 family)